MFKKILIANRGEIAVRVMRACRELGIRTVAIYSDADRGALHIRYADEAHRIGPPPSAESYLRIDAILDAARDAGVEAVHPGYGFLSENPGFARACEKAGIIFIGPSAQAMELMGSKTAARRAAKQAGLPVVPGTETNLETLQDIKEAARRAGYPVMLKASSGGGGKGLRTVEREDEIESAFLVARSEALNAFGDGSVYVEKFLTRPRHIEIQILGDHYGRVIHLGERECSLQRRHQKVLEESPSPFVGASLRSEMGEAAVRIGKFASYTNAGTVEFLADQEGRFYFLEMNTRIQVEHPVTEAVTGIDLVKAQVRIAAGDPLPWTQEEIGRRGHALECRIYAEDPANNFFPSPGLIRRLRVPMGPGVRDDSGVYEGWTVPIEYDPLLSKLVAWGSDREEALARMRRALDEYEVTGIKTNIGFFRRLLGHPDFVRGCFDTGFLDRLLAEGFATDEDAAPEDLRAAALAAAMASFRNESRAPRREHGMSRWKAAGRDWLLNNRHYT
ncbi:MAG: acetyl-CoA carboxylase biotin carboxylase subunit [Acidobacteriota bacterium]|nr:acetyl-CoA carboxylase biotin carboxylase subunit [Acidobacteriota bacterium]